MMSLLYKKLLRFPAYLFGFQKCYKLNFTFARIFRLEMRKTNAFVAIISYHQGFYRYKVVIFKTFFEISCITILPDSFGLLMVQENPGINTFF